MSYVYLIEKGQLINDEFKFYDKTVKSSKAKAIETVENNLDVNNGYCVSRDTKMTNSQIIYMVTYNTVSTDGKSMRVRDCIYKIKVE